MLKSLLPSTLQRDHWAKVCIATKLAPYSQFGFANTPRNFGIRSGERPAYGPRNTLF